MLADGPASARATAASACRPSTSSTVARLPSDLDSSAPVVSEVVSPSWR